MFIKIFGVFKDLLNTIGTTMPIYKWNLIWITTWNKAYLKNFY